MARKSDGLVGGDQNNTGNNTDFNLGPRNKQSARENEGIEACARPRGPDKNGPGRIDADNPALVSNNAGMDTADPK